MVSLNIGEGFSLVVKEHKRRSVDYHEVWDGIHVDHITTMHPNVVPRRRIDHGAVRGELEVHVSWRIVEVSVCIGMASLNIGEDFSLVVKEHNGRVSRLS